MMTTMVNSKRHLIGYLHWLIGILIMGSGYVLPASEPLTPMGVHILMIFVGMIYLWCTVNPIGSSFLALFAVGVVGYAPFSQVLADGVSDSSWLTVFFTCILFMSAIESGMPRYVSHAIFKATQGMVSGRPMVLVFILMMAAFVLSALTNIIPVILMFWSICYAIIEDLKLEKRDKYSMFLVVAAFMGATLGNALFPFKGATIIIISAFKAASGLEMNYGSYIIIYLICSLLIMLAYCLVIKYLFRIDLTKVKNIDGKLLASEKLDPMSTSVKAHLIAVFGFIILVLLNSFLPKEMAITQFLSSLDVAGVGVVWLIILFMINENGKSIVKVGKVMQSMPWSAVFMVMAAVYLAGALKDKDVTGVIPWLKVVLNPVLGGHSQFVFATVIVALSMILTCFFHNGALGNMMMPVLFAVASMNNYNSVAIAMILTMTINVAFLAPSASNWAPLLHGNSEYVSLKDIWTYGLCFEILAFIIFLVLGMPLATMMV